MRTSAIPELLAKFDISHADLERVRAAGAVLKPRLDEFIDEFYEWMSSTPEYKVFFGSNPARLDRVKPMQRANWVSFLDANIDQAWIDARRHVGQVHAHIDLPNDIYFAAMSKSAAVMVRQLREARPPVRDVDAAVASIGKLMFLDTFLVIEEIAHISREKISVSTRALMRPAARDDPRLSVGTAGRRWSPVVAASPMGRAVPPGGGTARVGHDRVRIQPRRRPRARPARPSTAIAPGAGTPTGNDVKRNDARS